MKCSNCGEVINPGQKECPKCGKSFTNEPIDFGDVSQTDYENSTLVVGSLEEKEEKESNNKISIVKIIIFVLLFSIIGYLVFNYFKKPISYSKIEKIDSYLDDISSSKSGNIKVSIKKGNKINTLTGSFISDLSKPYFITDLVSNNSSNEITFGDESNHLKLMLDENNFYFTSNVIDNKAYSIPFSIPPLNKFKLSKYIEEYSGEDLKINFFKNTIDVKKRSVSIDEVTYSIYYTKENLYRLVISKPHKYLEINIDNDKYYYAYYVNDEKVFAGEFYVNEREDGRIYKLTYDTLDALRDITIEIKYMDVNDIKKIENATSINNISLLEYNSIKKELTRTFGF